MDARLTFALAVIVKGDLEDWMASNIPADRETPGISELVQAGILETDDGAEYFATDGAYRAMAEVLIAR